MAAERAELLANRYRLDSPIRRDSTGIMWQAHDLRLRRNVAIKEVPALYRADRPDLAQARRRALNEARSAARLSHPSIVTVHDLLEDKGRVWIVTEHLEGLTLKETVSHLGRLPVHWSAWVGFQILAGVRHAHAAGVVHGDIKPGNVVLTGDRVVLMDFGIAAFEEREPTASPTAPVPRSAAYVAPERMRGGKASRAADLFSLGATIYTAVEGRAPFASTDSTGPLGLPLSVKPRPMAKAGPLGPLIEGLLHTRPEARTSGEDAGLALEALLRHEGIDATTPGRRSERRLVADRPHA